MVEQNTTDGMTEDQRFYLHRFVGIDQALKAIDKGSIPFNYYETVPILPEDQMKGLRWGMLHALAGSYAMLKRLDATYEVQAYLAFENVKNMTHIYSHGK